MDVITSRSTIIPAWSLPQWVRPLLTGVMSSEATASFTPESNLLQLEAGYEGWETGTVLKVLKVAGYDWGYPQYDELFHIEVYTRAALEVSRGHLVLPSNLFEAAKLQWKLHCLDMASAWLMNLPEWSTWEAELSACGIRLDEISLLPVLR